MTTRLARFSCLALFLFLVASPLATAHAVVVSYIVSLDGPSESPPNASPGVGSGQVDLDLDAQTLHLQVSFAGLLGTTTNCHIHAPTAVAGSGTAGVATMTPTFAGFPAGVTAGAYDNTFDMTMASSFNAPYVTANGGTAAGAWAALVQAIADGKAYLNIHSSMFSGGEIRGFLVPMGTTATDQSTWGRVKALYR